MSGNRRVRSLIAIFLVISFFLSDLAVGLVYAADIVIDGKTETQVIVSNNITDITTNTISGVNAINSFKIFNVAQSNVVNLYIPDTATNLINLVHNERSEIYGMLNSIKDGQIGGNVYFLNPHGILVGESGVINVGSLAMITPTNDFMGGFFNDLTGKPFELSIQQVLEGQVPISDSGLVTIKGKVNAISDINIQGGKIGVENGEILSGAVYDYSAADFSDVVNINGLGSASGIEVTEAGNIVLKAEDNIDLLAESSIQNLNGDGEETGHITISSGSTINIKGDNSDAPSVISSVGDVTIAAEKSTDVYSPLGVLNAATAINLEFAWISGKNISLLSSSTVDFKWGLSNLTGIPVGPLPSFNKADSELTGIEAAMAIVGA